VLRRCADLPGSPAGDACPCHAPESVEQVLRSAGESLPTVERTEFERRFDFDFANIRIHRDERAAASAAAVDAHAYTVGNHIVFGAGN
jgi:hypothetical protein